MGAQSRIFRRVTSVLAPAYQVTIQVCPPIWWDHWGPLWSLLMLVPPWPLRHVTAVLAPFLSTLLGFMLSFRKITFTGCIYDTASSYRHKYDCDLNLIWPLSIITYQNWFTMTLTRRTRGIIQFLFLIHGEETKSTVIWGYSSRAGFVSLNDFERWCHGRDSVDQWPGLLPIPKPDSWRPPVWRALWLTGKAPLEATVIFILEHFSSLGKIVLPPFSNWRQ